MTSEEFLARLPEAKDSSLDELMPRLEALRVPALQLAHADFAEFNHFGGCPLVPDGFVWPEYQGKPLSFLLQLDLATVPNIGVPRSLPANGYLHFFYDQDQDTWGFDPKDWGSWRVFYSEGDAEEFSEAGSPERLSSDAVFSAQPLEVRPIKVYPAWDSPQIDALELDDDQAEAYYDLVSRPFAKDASHQLLGVANPIQGSDMELTCQFASNGIYMGDLDFRQDPRYDELAPGAPMWKLMLQLDSDDDLGFGWGGDGRLYFWIHEDDLARRNFENVWMILQCS